MNIKQNMGTIDRVLRFLVAAVIILLYFTNTIDGVTAVVLLILSVVFIVTSFISFCPLYLPFNFTTKQKNNE